jgi:PAS domain S-box-containing protein
MPTDSDARIRAILDGCSDAYFELDSEGLVADWNYQAEKMFGWPRADVVGLALPELIIPERNRELFASTLRRMPNERVEITAFDRSGNELQIQLTIFPILERLGVFARDLTALKRAADEAEKLHRDLMDQLAEPYIEVDLRGRFVFVNKSYCEVFGVTAPSARTGVSYKDAIASKSQASIREAYQEVFRTGRARKIEYPILALSGAETYVESSVALRRDAQGQPVGFMAFARDLSARKRYEDEMAIAINAAEAASRAKGEFLANMSHEIRTPLNGVIGMLDLARDAGLTADQSELIEMAATSANNLLGLISDILDFSKIEAGKLEFDRVEFDLADMLAQLSRSMGINAHAKGLDLVCSIAPETPRFLLGDPMRLTQVLINLLGNAIKFTAEGKVALRVAIDAPSSDQQAQLRFSVTDTGIGIEAGKQNSIFDAFSQADASTTRTFGGTGLGLTICSRIVQLMGGNIWVESEAGKGSTFHFTTSFEIANGTGLKLEGNARGVDHTRRNTRSLKILLAEDNPINQTLAMRLLDRLGHRVVLASNGREAVDALAGGWFDLVLMDVQMPDMDGFTATAAIRAQEEASKTHIPIVAMTAHAMTGDRERCLEAGMDDYISKPINPGLLRETIERIGAVGVLDAGSGQLEVLAKTIAGGSEGRAN